MRKVARNLTLKRRSVRVCLPGAWSPECWRPTGLPQGRGAPRPQACTGRPRSKCLHCAPLNGRKVKPQMRLTFSKSARARAIACARVALRVCDVFLRCLTRRPSYLKYYFKSKDPFKRTRVRLHAWGRGLFPYPGGAPSVLGA